MDVITVEEAIRSNDRLIGAFVIIVWAILFICWLYVSALGKQYKRKTAKAVAKAVASERERFEIENRAKGASNFAQAYAMRQEIRHLKSELEEYKALVKRSEGEIGRLKRLLDKSHV